MDCFGFPLIFGLLFFFVFAKGGKQSRLHCGRCGERNPARANFCRRCGASLSEWSG